jgi:tRNA synthetases class I (I, L, M and V)
LLLSLSICPCRSAAQAAGLAIKQQPYVTRVPRSQRGGEVVEPLVRDQWFVRMATLAEPALGAVADGRIRIVPERFGKVYNNWLENIKVRPRRSGACGGPTHTLEKSAQQPSLCARRGFTGGGGSASLAGWVVTSGTWPGVL